MKNLKSLGVQELTPKEISETDGGVLPILLGIAIIMLCTSSCGAAPGCAAAKAVYE